MVQVTARLSLPVTLADINNVLPAFTLAVPGVTVTPIAGFTVTTALPLFVPSTTLVAVTVTSVDAPTASGAVYNPVAESEPTDGLIVHTTPAFEVPLTDALSCTPPPADTVAVDGVTATPTKAVCVDGLIFKVETALFVESKTLLAVTVTTVCAPTLAGAVYRPFAAMVPSNGDRLQVTVWFPVP